MESGENIMNQFDGKGGRLEGKVAVVTGGSTGIGLAIVKEFLQQGAKVAIASRTAHDLGDLPERLRLNPIAVAADVSKSDDLTRLFDKTAESFGKIDVVVANAGVSKFAPLEQVTEDDFRWIFDINVKGMFFTVQNALPHLNSGASIILTTSLGGHVGAPGAAMYYASKAAGRSLARSLAAELVGRNIRVNALSPGATDTSMFDRLGVSGDRLKALKASTAEQIPMKRLGRPEELAKAALFLASDDSSYLLGAEIMVDGGQGQL